VAATAWVKVNLPNARLFNDYGWGGYLIAVSYPQQRVYMDGREEMYGEPFFDRFIHTFGGDPGWQRTLADSGVNAAIINPKAPLVAAMDADPGWQRVFADGVAVVFTPVSSTAP